MDVEVLGVRAGDGRAYVLRRDLADGRWELEG